MTSGMPHCHFVESGCRVSEPKYPEASIRLVGENGNAFSILGRTTDALRRAGVPKEERDAYHAEATSGDFGHLLRTTMAWVSTDEDDEDD